MREVEKLDAGLPYSFWDKEVNTRKLHALKELPTEKMEYDERAFKQVLVTLQGSAP